MNNGVGNEFLDSFRDVLIAFAFSLLGLFSGFLVATFIGLLGVFSWGITLFPSLFCANAIINALFSDRLSAGLYLGTIVPRVWLNTRSFHSLFNAFIVANLFTSMFASLTNFLYATLFLRLSMNDFAVLSIVAVGAMTLSLPFLFVVAKITCFSFSRGLDHERIAHPLVSSLSGLCVTCCYIFTVKLASASCFWALIFFVVLQLLLAFLILAKNVHNHGFLNLLKELTITMTSVVLVLGITGAVFRQISNIAVRQTEIYIVYPVLLSLATAAGAVFSSTTITKFVLGLLEPNFNGILKNAKSLFGIWLASMFSFLTLFLSPTIVNIALPPPSMLRAFTMFLALTGFVAMILITLLAYSFSVITFKKGLDYGRFVLPIESSFVSVLLSIAMLIAFILVK